MRSELNKSYNNGFFLNEQELRRLFDICLQQIKIKSAEPLISIEILFANGVITELNDIDSIFLFENDGSSFIHRIGFLISNQDNTNDKYKIFLSFTNLLYSNEKGNKDKSISFQIEGTDRDWVFITTSQIEERIKRVKKISYNPKTMIFIIIFIIMNILMIFTYSSFDAINNRTTDLVYIEQQWNSNKIDNVGQLVIDLYKMGNKNYFAIPIWITFLPFLLLIPLLPLNGLIYYLFPLYNFYWGDYVRIYDRKKNIKNIIWIGVVLAIIVSVFSSFLYDKWFK